MTESSLCQQAGIPHHEQPSNRRDFLQRSGAGFGALALQYLLAQGEAESNQLQAAPKSPLAPKPTHHPATAKNVIFLFMEGGPSQIDTFDRKPLLNKLAGKPLPSSFKEPITAMGEKGAPLLAAPRKWKQHGQSGLWVSEWLPHIAGCIDDISVIRSCWGNGINHAGGVMQMNTGSPIGGRPSLGAWVTYGLGTENENLPAFVVLTDTTSQVVNGPRSWGTGFMPAVYQGTHFSGKGNNPIPDLRPPSSVSDQRQRRKLDFLNSLNEEHRLSRQHQTELEARIKSYELAFRMQASAPEAVNLADETEATKALYGLDKKETQVFGRNCLLARRLVERGVRFVQLYHGAGSKWDSHTQIEKNHSRLCKEMDLPVAGLLKDLKQRGLLDETLVIWGGEFGRTPMSEKGNGRDHNPTGFTMWMAGGGVKGGQTIGATDELGLHAIEERVHIHDFHTSILHLLGLHNLKLTYYYKGRPERPTINEGEFVKKLVTG